METLNILNASVMNRFSVLLKSNRLAHSYLFIGPYGVGKRETALGAAKLINCADNVEGSAETFCDQCSSCLKIENGNHPDVVVIETEPGETIKIEQIRELIDKVQLRPFEARRKVFIINGVEKMTVEAGNALLKTLEEPSSSSLLLLTTAVPEKVLPTVKSRCHMIRFFPSSKERLADLLIKDYYVDEFTAHFLAHFSEGSLGRARNLNDDKVFQRKNDIIDQFILARYAEDYVKGALSDRTKTKEMLDVLLSWFRDLLLVKSGLDEQECINVDRIHDLKKHEERYSFDDLKEIISQIVNAKNLANENLNVKMALTLIKERL